MRKKREVQDKKNDAAKKHPVLRSVVIAAIVFALFIGVLYAVMLVNNNVSFVSDEVFAEQIDVAIENALAWTRAYKNKIMTRKNVGLIKMLNDINKLKPTPVFSDIVENLMASPAIPNCSKRLLDTNCPTNEAELNASIKEQPLDNKWILYVVAPDKANITPEQLQLFDPHRWWGRRLAHQLDALTTLRETKGPNEEIDWLIEHICSRLRVELTFDALVVDIGKNLFIMRAGHPEKIRRRWIERIIAKQSPDGGWDNRRLCFSSNADILTDFASRKTNQHDTLLALATLYMVKYKYPEHFGLKKSIDTRQFNQLFQNNTNKPVYTLRKD